MPGLHTIDSHTLGGRISSSPEETHKDLKQTLRGPCSAQPSARITTELSSHWPARPAPTRPQGCPAPTPTPSSVILPETHVLAPGSKVWQRPPRGGQDSGVETWLNQTNRLANEKGGFLSYLERAAESILQHEAAVTVEKAPQ